MRGSPPSTIGSKLQVSFCSARRVIVCTISAPTFSFGMSLRSETDDQTSCLSMTISVWSSITAPLHRNTVDDPLLRHEFISDGKEGSSTAMGATDCFFCSTRCSAQGPVAYTSKHQLDLPKTISHNQSWVTANVISPARITFAVQQHPHTRHQVQVGSITAAICKR